MPILEELKQGTSDHHRRIESVPLLARIADKTTAQDYRTLLLKFFGFYFPLEQRLSRHPWNEVPLQFERRRKTAALASDLAALGVAESERNAQVPCSRLPSCGDLASALGCLYVLEGSTLGGQILKARVRASGAFPVEFLEGYGPRTASMWREFRESTNRFAELRGGGDRMIASAKETFELLQRWLESEVK